jgi:hypothetical protein
MKQQTYGARQPIHDRLEHARACWFRPLALFCSAVCCSVLALGSGCVGGELRAKSASASQLEGASDTPPAGWKPAREQAFGEARSHRGTRNLFVELLGKSQTEVEEKVQTAVNRFFGIGTNEPAELIRDSGYRVYYELPQDPSMAFIWAPDSNDVRSEGMSYGMTVAVQMNLRAQFDKLWKFARTYMQYPGDARLTAWRHYFG